MTIPSSATVVLFAALAGGSVAAPRVSETRTMGESSRVENGHDFGFLVGKWTIRHRRLSEAMVGSNEWKVFDTRYEAWQLLGGAASMDRVYGEVDGEAFEGVSVRTLDRATGEWIIYWMDIWNTSLREQVRGRFEDGVGTFYGEEAYRGTTYRMRFLWKDITKTTARWEQAYQHPESGVWETNWIMEFRKEDE